MVEPFTYPADWIFGGFDGDHPAADSRFIPGNYVYLDEDLDEITRSSAPTDDAEAIQYADQVEHNFRVRAHYIQVRRGNAKDYDLMWTRSKGYRDGIAQQEVLGAVLQG